jgi:hypothetical protein
MTGAKTRGSLKLAVFAKSYNIFAQFLAVTYNSDDFRKMFRENVKYLDDFHDNSRKN